MPLQLGWAVAVAAMGAFYSLISGNVNYAPGACERLEPFLSSRILGQDLALRQISDAICDHLAQPEPARPLVLSLHGPPGVGKSMFHLLAAHALYNRQPDRPGLRCPGLDCAGYKVLYGMDYTADERAAQHSALRAALLDHVRHAPESLLVVEEYDKLDCPMRGFFRQLLENGAVANTTLNKAIIVLESNLGYTELHDLLLRAGDRSKIAPEEAQRVLKDMVFSRWLAEGCEERSDTMKMVGMVSFFLPFFPLERRHIRQLFAIRLAERAAELQKARLGALQWEESVLAFLTEKARQLLAGYTRTALNVLVLLYLYHCTSQLLGDPDHLACCLWAGIQAGVRLWPALLTQLRSCTRSANTACDCLCSSRAGAPALHFWLIAR